MVECPAELAACQPRLVRSLPRLHRGGRSRAGTRPPCARSTHAPFLAAHGRLLPRNPRRPAGLAWHCSPRDMPAAAGKKKTASLPRLPPNASMQVAGTAQSRARLVVQGTSVARGAPRQGTRAGGGPDAAARHRSPACGHSCGGRGRPALPAQPKCPPLPLLIGLTASKVALKNADSACRLAATSAS